MSSDFMPMEPLESELALELEPAALMDMPLRVWAEIGRVRMPAAFVVGMPHGAIVDLDSDPDEPADLFVNGRHYGTGRLILVEGEWALRVESLDAEPGVVASPEGGGAGVEQTSSSDQEQPPAAD